MSIHRLRHSTSLLTLLGLALLCSACPDAEEPAPDLPADQPDASTTPADMRSVELPDMSVAVMDMNTPTDQGTSPEDQAVGFDADMVEQDMPDMTVAPAVNPLCELGAQERQATGQDRPIMAGQDALANALAQATPGDRIVLSEGVYSSESIEDVAFDADVFIEAAPGATVTIQGLSCVRCAHLVFRGVEFVSDPDDADQRSVVNLDASSHVTFDGVRMTSDPGQSTLRIYGQRNGACAHIAVYDSEISGGQRTIFIQGKFAPSEEWNHTLTFVRNTITCGTSTCMQVSGGRDMVIADNLIRSSKGVGLLTAGATRVEVSRNIFEGSGEARVAMNLATPGTQWDNFRGVDHMLSTSLQVTNNLVMGWSNVGIQLNAVRDVDIAHNTLMVPTGLRTSHRLPQKWMSEEVILEGNQDYRLWHNIIDQIVIDGSDPRPSFESHNLVLRGGAGEGLIELDAMLAGAPDYAPLEGSPVVDAGEASAPPLDVTLDRFGQVRQTPADLGALEFGSTPPQCP